MAASLASTACKDDPATEPASLEVACSEQRALPYRGATVRIVVETDAAWNAAKASDDDWYTLSATSGTGSASIELTAEANASDNPRKGTVTVTAGPLRQSVEITQLGRSSEPPAAAGAIEGKEEGAVGETIELSVAPIEGASDYKWYRDGIELQTGTERTLRITAGGVYKVAGVNVSGEGAASPEKRVTYDNAKYVFTKAQASYEGGDYNKEYHVRLSSPTGPDSEVGLVLIFCEKEPEGVDDPAIATITLPARDYLATQPLYNNYSSEGVVLPCDNWEMNKSRFYVIEEGAYLPEGYKYLCETGGFEFNKDEWAYDFASVKVEYDPAGRSYTISGAVPCFTVSEGVTTPAGVYEFRYEGPLAFKNNWRAYDKFYFTEDDLDEDLDLVGQITQTSTLRYGGKINGEGHYWHLELWQNSMDQPGWDIIMDFYTPAENGMKAPYGTYTVAETPQAGVPMTADRGFYLKPDFHGLKCQRWNPQGGGTGNGEYDIHVLGQPDERSHVKLSDNGSGGYLVEVVMFDARGHRITAQYSGAIEIENMTQTNVRSAFKPAIPFRSNLRK